MLITRVIVAFIGSSREGLKDRFTPVLPHPLQVTEKANQYKATTLDEISEVVQSLPASYTIPGNITVAMIKIMFDLSPSDLGNFINFPIENAWVNPDRKIAKITPLLQSRQLVSAI